MVDTPADRIQWICHLICLHKYCKPLSLGRQTFQPSWLPKIHLDPRWKIVGQGVPTFLGPSSQPCAPRRISRVVRTCSNGSVCNCTILHSKCLQTITLAREVGRELQELYFQGLKYELGLWMALWQFCKWVCIQWIDKIWFMHNSTIKNVLLYSWDRCLSSTLQEVINCLQSLDPINALEEYRKQQMIFCLLIPSSLVEKSIICFYSTRLNSTRTQIFYLSSLRAPTLP